MPAGFVFSGMHRLFDCVSDLDGEARVAASGGDSHLDIAVDDACRDQKGTFFRRVGDVSGNAAFERGGGEAAVGGAVIGRGEDECEIFRV
jgi:hypothetical protein